MREAYIQIHHALHSDQGVVTINNIDYPILKAGNGCRYVTFEGIRIMQQNARKNSSYADRARAGEKISWAMTEPSWTLIDDAAIRLFTSKTAANVPGKSTQPGNSTSTYQRKPKTGNRRDPGNFWRSPQ